MKKFSLLKAITLVMSGALLVGGLASCTNGGGNQPSDNPEDTPQDNPDDNPEDGKWNITFVNYDGSVIYTTTALDGTMPQFSGNAPTKPSDEQYNYKFAGWEPTLVKATEDATYTAVYTSRVNVYSVKIGEDPAVSLEYGSKLTQPTSPADYLDEDEGIFFSFDGWEIEGSGILWDFETDTVKNDVVLVPHYVQTEALTVKFYDLEGNLLDEHMSGKGQTPVYKGQNIPTKVSSIEKDYTFSGWEPALAPIESDQSYTPTFSESTRQYDIKFYNYDGSLIKTVKTDYGSVPVYQDQDPVKPNDEFYSYTFSGWSPDLIEVDGEASYTAQYTRNFLDPVTVTVNQYIDDSLTPVYSESFDVANHTTYTVDSKFHNVLAEGYNQNEFALKSSDIVDLYLIAGQSNAAGYSHVDYLSNGKRELYPETPHVTFYGEIDSRFVSDITTPVSFGLGASANHFGPEVGMAKVISENNPNGLSTIVKTAYGGSWLYDYQSDDVSRKYGNWCSPSMRDGAANPDITGKCYDEFILNVNNAANYYKDNGYMVRLSGMIWIQGEQESSQANSSEYGEHLEALINDLRSDFSDIFDYNATTAPFVIGKISSTFAGGHLGVDNVRLCEEQVAAKMDNVYALETYEICDPTTKQPNEGCYDKYHFSADDMLLIGERAATLMGEEIVPEGTSEAVNVLRKEVNGATTFDLYFETLEGGSYNIEYYFQDGENYVKNDYFKVVESTQQNPFFTGDKVTCSVDMPAEVIDLPTLPSGYEWQVNYEKSITTGFVVSDGKLSLKVFFSAMNPYDNNYTISFNESYWKSNGLSGKVGNITQKSSTNEEFGFSTNEWIEYTVDGWGSFITNGAHWDSYFKNTSAIKGIKQIEIHIWWNIFNYSEEEKVPYVNLSTSNDANFANDVTKTRIYKGTGAVATQGERFVLPIENYPSYFKIDFGDNANNTFFDSIMSLKISYCGKDAITPDVCIRHNVNVSIDGENRTYVASCLDDGASYSNMKASYAFFGSYNKASIVSVKTNMINTDSYRAYSGLVVTNGAKLDGTLDGTNPRNLKAYQVGLSYHGLYSCCDLNGTRGRDSGNANYFPDQSLTVGSEAKLTFVIINDKVSIYVDDVLIKTNNLTSVDPCGGFQSGSDYMVGVWFHNYVSPARAITVLDEIYGEEAVAEEIASNDVYSALRS